MDMLSVLVTVSADQEVLKEVMAHLESDSTESRKWYGNPLLQNGNLVLDGIAMDFSELSIVCDIGERWPQATVTCQTTTSECDSAETCTDVWSDGEHRLVEHYLRTTDYEMDGLMEGKTEWYVRDGQVVTPYWSQSESFNPDPDPDPETCLDMDIPTFEDQGYSSNEVPREPLQDDDQRWEPCMGSETRMNASMQSDEDEGRPDQVPEQLSDEQFLRELEEFIDAGRFPLDTPHPGESTPEDAKRNGKDRTDWAKEGF